MIAARQLNGDLDGALADYNQAIALDPRFADAWFNRATYWKANDELGRADADFSQAIELKPHLADAHAARGLVRLLKGRRADEAQQDFDRCLALNNNLRAITGTAYCGGETAITGEAMEIENPIVPRVELPAIAH